MRERRKAMTSFNSNVITKTFAVLKAFTDVQMEWGVHELSRYLHFPASSLHRILKILKSEDILQISPETGKYKFGPEMVRMASIISVDVDLKKVAKPYMRRLSAAFDESVYLTQYHPQHKKLTFIDCVNSSKPLQYVIEIGVLQEVHIAASGKSILAFLDKDEIEAVFQTEKVDEEKQQELYKEMKRIRKQGYSMTVNERKQGALSIAAPIYDASLKVIGSLVYNIPANRFDERLKDEVAKQIIQEAGNISHALGFRRESDISITL
jgi:DNA-binding IclR family transcriptional regulator